MKPSSQSDPWGLPPWRVDFNAPEQMLPASAEVAIIGGGFTGLATAAWVKRLAPEKSVVVLEASRIGAGASGRTGGIALAETAAGDLPGLGDVLSGFRAALDEFEIDCELSLEGAWEIGRHEQPLENSPIDWRDSGRLRVIREVPGGTLDPGKLVSGLARAAHRLGVRIFENASVERVDWGERATLTVRRKDDSRHLEVTANRVLFATNAYSLGTAGLESAAHPKLALSTLTAPVSEDLLQVIGLSQRKPFYTIDFPYLWGRVYSDNSIMLGAGLLDPPDSGDIRGTEIASSESSQMFKSFERRVRGFHPAFETVRFTHYWGGPILFPDGWRPVFDWHPQSRKAIVLGAYAGHGVALSVYLGKWAAEALLGPRDLPAWGRIGHR